MVAFLIPALIWQVRAPRWAAVAVGAVAFGMAPTAWRLYRRPVAAMLSETGR
jgi:hypothetical protein